MRILAAAILALSSACFSQGVSQVDSQELGTGDISTDEPIGCLCPYKTKPAGKECVYDYLDIDNALDPNCPTKVTRASCYVPPGGKCEDQTGRSPGRWVYGL